MHPNMAPPCCSTCSISQLPQRRQSKHTRAFSTDFFRMVVLLTTLLRPPWPLSSNQAPKQHAHYRSVVGAGSTSSG